MNKSESKYFATAMRMDEAFLRLLEKKDRHYIMAFYIHGIMAIISEWLRTDCDDSIEYIIKVIQQCVKRHREEKEK